MSNNTNESKNKIVDNTKIFKFLDPNGNDKLSKLSGLDLQDLIVLIDEYYLQLREQLGFPNDVTFGVELEFEYAMRLRIKQKLKRAFPDGKYKTHKDVSLFLGAEISSPVLSDKKACWEELEKVCSIVRPCATIGKNSGGHVHVGAHILGKKETSWLNFLKMWSVYENIIYRFSYGDYLISRPRIYNYAEPMTNTFMNDYETLKQLGASTDNIIYRIAHSKCQSVNFDHVNRHAPATFQKGNSIEFRCPNGSLNPVIWQNNINLFVNMLFYANSSAFNDDIVERRNRLKTDYMSKLKWYDEIYLEQALEFCDLVFTNNFDKVYFLRQYLKSMEVCKSKVGYPKAQKITKKGMKE